MAGKDDVAGDVGQESRDLDSKVVEQGLSDGDDRDERHDLEIRARPKRNGSIRCGRAEQGAKSALKEVGRADVDRAQNGDQAQQVQPGCKPAPEPAAQDRGPVVKPARCREGRGDLRHGKREHPRQEAAHDPADTSPCAADRGDAEAKDPVVGRADPRHRHGFVEHVRRRGLRRRDGPVAGSAARAVEAAQSAQSAPAYAAATDDDSAQSQQPFVRTGQKVGRNDPCPCGSGKKFKQCHGRLT